MSAANTLPRIMSVGTVPIPGSLRLVIVWAGATESVVDMTGPVYRLRQFAPLRDPALFTQVRVIDDGYAIGWPGDLDFSGSSLARLAAEQAPFTAADFVAWQRDLSLSNQEAADLLDVSLTTIKNYRTREGAIPTPVKIACRATKEDRLLLQAHFHPRLPGRPRVRA